MSSILEHNNNKPVHKKKTKKDHFLNYTCISFSCNKFVVCFLKYLCYISSWKLEVDDIRSIQWNSPNYLLAKKLSIPSFPAAILSDMATMSAGRPTELKQKSDLKFILTCQGHNLPFHIRYLPFEPPSQSYIGMYCAI